MTEESAFCSAFFVLFLFFVHKLRKEEVNGTFYCKVDNRMC